MEPANSKWIHALRRVADQTLLITAQALAAAERAGGEITQHDVLLANRYLNRLAKRGRLVRLDRGRYALPDRLAELEALGDEVVARLGAAGWQGIVDVWRAYLLLHASDLRDACWRRPDRGLLIQSLPGYSARERDALVLALWAAAQRGVLARLRRGVYALPGTVQPEQDMASLSLRMSDPLVTPRRAKLLYVYWLGLLDEDQVAGLWEADDARVDEALGRMIVKRLNVAYYLAQAVTNGCLVRVENGCYLHRDLVGDAHALANVRSWQRALQLALSQFDFITAHRLAAAYLELQGMRPDAIPEGTLRVARNFLANLAKQGRLVRVIRGHYAAQDAAERPEIPARSPHSLPDDVFAAQDAAERAEIPALLSSARASRPGLVALLSQVGWRGMVDASRAYLLLYASDEVRAALWRRPDRVLLLRELEDFSEARLSYAREALHDAAKAGKLVKLRRGVYALPGTVKPEQDMASLSLRMSDSLVTPRRAKLLFAYWLGLLDEDQVAGLWEADDAQVREVLGEFAADFRAAHFLKQALARGCLVKLGHGRYAHPASGMA